MAYNNNFPIGYQQQYYPQYYPQYQAPQTPQTQNNNGVIWVQGINGAKSYLVGPNSTVALWDSESSTIYLKSADASGMPSMKILDYTVREQSQNSAPISNDISYATKDDIAAIRDELGHFRSRLDSLSNKKDRRDGKYE